MKINRVCAVYFSAVKNTKFIVEKLAKEIAEKLDIAVETVKKQKQIARKILKEKFGKLFLFLPAVLFS